MGSSRESLSATESSQGRSLNSSPCETCSQADDGTWERSPELGESNSMIAAECAECRPSSYTRGGRNFRPSDCTADSKFWSNVWSLEAARKRVLSTESSGQEPCDLDTISGVTHRGGRDHSIKPLNDEMLIGGNKDNPRNLISNPGQSHEARIARRSETMSEIERLLMGESFAIAADLRKTGNFSKTYPIDAPFSLPTDRPKVSEREVQSEN